jgi:hypothetical protein
MGLTANSGSNAGYVNATFDKGLGQFVLDKDREVVRAIKAEIGYEDKHGYSRESASRMLEMAKERKVPTFGGVAGELVGVELFEKDNARYYKVRVAEDLGEGKKEFTTLTMSVSNTGARNNGHVTGLIASLNQLKPGDNIDVGVWMAQAKDRDGNPVQGRNGDDIYNAASIVKKDGEKVSIAGKTLITKETFAAKKEALATAGLDKEQIGKAIDADEVKLILDKAREQAARMPARNAREEAHAAASEQHSDEVPYAGAEQGAEEAGTASKAAGQEWD